MKIVNFTPLLLLTLVLSVAVSGCKKTPKSPTPIFGRGVTAPGGSNPGGLDPGSGPTLPLGTDPSATRLPSGLDGADELGAREELGNYFLDRDVFRQQTIYFGFDRFNVRPSELPKAQAVADYLRAEPSAKVLVEGHCDERGTPEYNRSLGERRALSIRESLMQLGLGSERIQTISYGEDKPADPGYGEASWEKNRRGEFVLLRPKSGGATAEFR